jgi:hypothetical protein
VGKLNQGQDYLRVGGQRGLYQSRSGLPKSRRPARIVSEVGTTKGWVCEVAEEDNGWCNTLLFVHLISGPKPCVRILGQLKSFENARVHKKF